MFQGAIDLLLGDLSHVLLVATFHHRLFPLCLLQVRLLFRRLAVWKIALAISSCEAVIVTGNDRLGYTLDLRLGVNSIPLRWFAHDYNRYYAIVFTAVRIGCALGTTLELWLNLQRMYHLDLARSTTDVGSVEALVEAPAPT